MDADARIPAALQALGPVADRDVCVIDGTDAVLAGVDGALTGHLLSLGGWVRSLPGTSLDPLALIPDGRADVLVSGWIGFPTGRARLGRAARGCSQGAATRTGDCWSSTTTGGTR